MDGDPKAAILLVCLLSWPWYNSFIDTKDDQCSDAETVAYRGAVLPVLPL
jgi:hypothetical protein